MQVLPGDFHRRPAAWFIRQVGNLSLFAIWPLPCLFCPQTLFLRQSPECCHTELHSEWILGHRGGAVGENTQNRGHALAGRAMHIQKCTLGPLGPQSTVLEQRSASPSAALRQGTAPAPSRRWGFPQQQTRVACLRKSRGRPEPCAWRGSHRLQNTNQSHIIKVIKIS